jgi:hypothetical protein
MNILAIKFRNIKSYEEALEFFQTDSSFSVSEEYKEFLTLDFEVNGEDDADATEMAIREELENEFPDMSYEFMFED